MEDKYVNHDLGITFQGRFAVITLDESGKLHDAYIGSGHHLSYKGLTISADENSHAAYVEN